MNSNNINDNDNGKDDQNVLCDSIYQRRSIRKYKKEEISGEILEKILDAARVAPSGKNRQPWKFLVYGGEEKKEILKKMRAGIKRELKEPLFKHASHYDECTYSGICIKYKRCKSYGNDRYGRQIYGDM